MVLAVGTELHYNPSQFLAGPLRALTGVTSIEFSVLHVALPELGEGEIHYEACMVHEC